VAPVIWLQRGAVALLWLLVLLNCLAWRGIYWDGAAFLARMIEFGGFHDGHTARAHVLWATQWPAVVALRLGVTDTAMLALVYSAGLFAVPAALYHLALYRVREEPALLAAVMAIVVAVYMPTSFFIVGEYNAAYAATTAGAAIVLTARGLSLATAAGLLALGLFCLRSYEAMLYLGPLLAAMVGWLTLRAREARSGERLVAWTAAGFFLAAAVVALVPAVREWGNDYVTRVRGAVFDFWQNLQFMIALATLGAVTVAMLVRPALLRGTVPVVIVTAGIALLIAAPFRELFDLYAPSHYVARSAAGGLLWLMLAAMWLFVAWQTAPPRLFAVLREPLVGRRLAVAVFALLLAAAVPDIALTRLWSQYLGQFRQLVASGTGVVYAEIHMPGRASDNMFRQGWTYPALSLLLRGGPSNALVLPKHSTGEPVLYDPACGLPPFTGFAWRG
jgi:hypothetical protein